MKNIEKQLTINNNNNNKNKSSDKKEIIMREKIVAKFVIERKKKTQVKIGEKNFFLFTRGEGKKKILN